MKKVLVLVVWCLCWPSPTFASVIISEVHPQPESGSEWIELHNPSDEAVMLADWTLEDQLTTPSVIYQFFPTQVIEPQAYFTVEIVNRLNNSGDGVVLKDAQQTLIDSMSYSSSNLGLSWSRTVENFTLSQPSRNSPNPLPSPTVYPSPSPSVEPTPFVSPTPTPTPIPDFDPFDIVLSEIMACPSEGNREWVELFNPTDTPMTLHDWHISDWTGNTRPVSTTIQPQSYATIEWLSSLLNNTGDSLFLENNLGHIIAAATFPACTPNASFIWHNNIWTLTATPTANNQNQFTSLSAPTPTPTVIPSTTPKPSPKPSATPGQVLGSNILPPAQENRSSSKITETSSQTPPAQLTTKPRLTTLLVPVNQASPAGFIRVKPVPLSWLPSISVILGGAIMAMSSAYLWYDEYRDTISQTLA